MLVDVQVGQSEHPRPEPLSLTAPPLTMPTARAATDRAVLRRRKPGVAVSAHALAATRRKGGFGTPMMVGLAGRAVYQPALFGARATA